MSEITQTSSERQETNRWELVRALSIEARFARMAGVEPICSFIWDQEPKLIEVDGATVAVHELGPEGGTPVLSFHGNPGSARGPHPTRKLLETENIRLIAFDAPGFGDSPPVIIDNPLVTSGNIAQSVVEAFGYERVAVLARSGGVPRALGFAALHPESVSSMVLIAGPAPQAADIDWQVGMTAGNKEIYTEAQSKPSLAISRFHEISQKLLADEEYLIRDLWKEMSTYDKLIFELQPDLFLCTAVGHAAGASHDAAGWQQNVSALTQEWGFSLTDVKASTLIVHGDDDPYANIEHARWLQRNINQAELLEVEGGHFANWLQIRKYLIYLREQHLRGQRGVEEIGKSFVFNTVHLETAFSLRNLYDNYA